MRNLLFILLLVFPLKAHGDISKLIPEAIDAILLETESLHFSNFGQNELSKELIQKIGVNEVHREDGNYVVYQEANNEEFILYYFVRSHKLLFAYDKNKQVTPNDLLNEVKLATTGYSQGSNIPTILVMKDSFPPRMVEIYMPKMAPEKYGFSLNILPNSIKPINKFLADLAFDFMMYDKEISQEKILKQHLFILEEKGRFVRKFKDGTSAYVAIGDEVIGITATPLNLKEFEFYLKSYSTNSVVAPFFAMADQRYQVINLSNQRRFTVTVSADVRGEALDLNLPIPGSSGLRIYRNQ